jgi:hypothetical protein
MPKDAAAEDEEAVPWSSPAAMGPGGPMRRPLAKWTTTGGEDIAACSGGSTGVGRGSADAITKPAVVAKAPADMGRGTDEIRGERLKEGREPEGAPPEPA